LKKIHVKRASEISRRLALPEIRRRLAADMPGGPDFPVRSVNTSTASVSTSIGSKTAIISALARYSHGSNAASGQPLPLTGLRALLPAVSGWKALN
jgi:hypothetical protein